MMEKAEGQPSCHAALNITRLSVHRLVVVPGSLQFETARDTLKSSQDRPEVSGIHISTFMGTWPPIF